MVLTNITDHKVQYSHRHFNLEVYIMVTITMTVDTTNALACQPMTIMGLCACWYLHI